VTLNVTSPGTFECLGPISRKHYILNRMEPSPGHNGPSVQFKISNVYVSGTRTGGIERRQPRTSNGRYYAFAYS